MHVHPHGSIESIGKGEHEICMIHRHPVGLILLYFQFILATFLGFGLIGYLLKQFFSGETLTRYSIALSLVSIFILALIALLLLLVTFIYGQNKIILSDLNVTQISQRGIFNRQVSELSLANVEDVTSEQKGIFPTIFNYGVLRIETAGEQNNFHFIYCPKPSYYGKIVLDARDSFLTHNPEDTQG